MALINRVSRLFKADFNAVLDQLEEPELILRQAIREMEENLAECEQDIDHRIVDQENLAGRCKELEASLDEVSEQLDLCFDSGKDDLARSFLRRKLEAEHLLKQLRSRVAINDGLLRDQRAKLDVNATTLEGLRQKAALFSDRRERSEVLAFDHNAMVPGATVSDDEVEVAFLREKRARSAS